jgi:hypothetical protein
MQDSAQGRPWRCRVFRVVEDVRGAWWTEGAVEVADGSSDGLSGKKAVAGARQNAWHLVRIRLKAVCGYIFRRLLCRLSTRSLDTLIEQLARFTWKCSHRAILQQQLFK